MFILLVLVVTACGGGAAPASISNTIISDVQAAVAEGNPAGSEGQASQQVEAWVVQQAADQAIEAQASEPGAVAQPGEAYAPQDGAEAATAGEAALTAAQDPSQMLAEQPAEAVNEPAQAAASDPTQAMGGGQATGLAEAANGAEAPAQKAAVEPVALNLESKAEVGFIAPDFSLQTLDGQTVRLADLRGRAVMISYWATWCNPCKAELPILQKLQAEFASQGLVVLTINAIEQDNLGEVQALAGQMGLSLPVLLDAQNYFQSTYKQMFFPTSYYIDANGVIRYIKLGDAPEAEMRTKLELLINNQL